MLYDELSEEAKERAIEKFSDINVDYDWWQSTVEFVRDEWLDKYGIDFEVDSLCFDLYPRYQTLYFQNGKIWVEDTNKLLAALPGGAAMIAEMVFDDEDELPVEFGFETYYYGGRDAKTALQVMDNRGAETPELPFDAEEWFADLCKDFWRTLEREYDDITSREAIEDTIRANDFQFSEDGELEV